MRIREKIMNLELEKLHEECAVFGASLNTDEAAGITYNALLAMQHRGQEGAGIAVLSGNEILCEKDVGLVSEVFDDKKLETLVSSLAVGHTRYSTTGNHSPRNVQPFVTEYLIGRISTVHNGNVTNARSIRERLEKWGLGFSANSDSEVISSLMAFEIMNSGNLLDGVITASKQLRGAFSLIVLSGEDKLVVIRDPNGFRPLCIGRNKDGMVAASESCALDSCGFKFVRDVRPGEIILIEKGEIVHEGLYLESDNIGVCIFEHVYFARPDSIIDGLSVNGARFKMGKRLAEEHPVDADVVCGVPDSGLDAASGYAVKSGLPLVSGFVKNRYIGRSFIFPTQSKRETAVKLKLNPLRANIEGKRIVLVDDSIVRGTTSAKIISALRSAGAKEIHMRISSPPFRYTCHFGTDIDKEENLIANKMSVEDIRKKIGADSLGFISVANLERACEKSNLPFCTGCFTGQYGAEIGEHTKSQLEVS